MNILVTGGAGYIGSHAVLRLLEDGHQVTVIDNLVRGNSGAITALQKIGAPGLLTFVEMDINDTDRVLEVLRHHKVEAVLHFAALAYVGESVDDPLRYYRSNLAGAISLIEACHAAGVERFVFSSTCSTYGEPAAEHIPIAETCPQRPVNPYGRSKLGVEHVLRDHVAACCRSDSSFDVIALRYFNVAGCDPKGRLGEDHKPETHLIPICLEAAIGQREALTIFGTDYATADGTCVRDYVHVTDLIDAHVRALDALDSSNPSFRAYNVGIGQGYSVREVVDAAQRITGIDFAVTEGKRRAGDPPNLFADPAKITKELGWQAERAGLDQMISDAWRWKQANPDGYAGVVASES